MFDAVVLVCLNGAIKIVGGARRIAMRGAVFARNVGRDIGPARLKVFSDG